MPVVSLPLIEDPVRDTSELIAGLIPAQGQLVIAGETETGKSLTFIEICHALLTQEPLWGALPVLAPVERILYVLGEHYPDTIRRQWLRMGLATPPGRFNLVGPDMLRDRALIADGKPQPHVIETIRTWAEGRGLIVFDPIASFIRGAGEPENNNIAMRALVETMTEIGQRVGATVGIPAHAGKPTIVKGREVSRTRYLVRGASGIEDAATNLFYLVADVDDVASGYQRFSLVKRKYKGQAPDRYELARDPVTGRQRLYRGHKEFQGELTTERRDRTEAAIERLRGHYGWTKDHAVQVLSLADGASTSSIYRVLRAA